MRLLNAVESTLDTFVAAAERNSDPGPLVLAALAYDSEAAMREHVLEAWLDALDADAQQGSIAFGPTCPMSGLAAAQPVVPRLGRLNRMLWKDVEGIWPRDRWRTRDIGWDDYDLISGPSGMLLNLAASGAPSPPLIELCTEQLLALCEDVDAFRLGPGQGGDLNRWNEGRINTSLAHGVAGVALALKAAAELRRDERVLMALARVSDWLVAQSYVDGRGVRTWSPGGLDGAEPPAAQKRQAWCYGAPGVAWTLWESGRVLGRADLERFALDAMASFCAAFDPGFHLDAETDARLCFCHGAAGTLAVADCFATHARFKPAAELARGIERLLSDQLESIAQIATQDLSLLMGAPGMLAVLLTREGAPRHWLIPLGLR